MTRSRSKRANFDLVARPYRWLEYVSFGGALERCRFYFLPQMQSSRSALLFGEGDGRFLARLLKQNAEVHADAVDSSATMLRMLGQRCKKEAQRLRCHPMDALDFVHRASAADLTYDLIVTHFFLDCLEQNAVDALTAEVARKTAPGAVWIVSDFRVPPGAMRLPATVLIRLLYFAFQLTTGLRTRRLPDHAASLERAAFSRIAEHRFLGGLLFTELWCSKH